MRLFLRLAAVLVLATTAVACSGSSTATAPTQNTSTDVDTGTVAAPINGVTQSDTKTFIVGQGGGTITVALTSSIETLPGGTFLQNVAMSLSVGQLTGITCVPLSGGIVVGAPGAAVIQGTVSAGTFCVVIADATGQLGPVAYGVSIIHP